MRWYKIYLNNATVTLQLQYIHLLEEVHVLIKPLQLLKTNEVVLYVAHKSNNLDSALSNMRNEKQLCFFATYCWGLVIHWMTRAIILAETHGASTLGKRRKSWHVHINDRIKIVSAAFSIQRVYPILFLSVIWEIRCCL